MVTGHYHDLRAIPSQQFIGQAPDKIKRHLILLINITLEISGAKLDALYQVATHDERLWSFIRDRETINVCHNGREKRIVVNGLVRRAMQVRNMD